MQISPIAGLASRILETRSSATPDGFQSELNQALQACQSGAPAPALEQEQREVLQTVAQHFQTLTTAGVPLSSPRFDTGFVLLQNLVR